MDEKRLQEYLELIKKLLFSSTDEEIYKILVENRNLLDVGFLQTITTEIEKALNQGDKSRADRLRYFLNAQNKAFNQIDDGLFLIFDGLFLIFDGDIHIQCNAVIQHCTFSSLLIIVIQSHPSSAYLP